MDSGYGFASFMEDEALVGVSGLNFGEKLRGADPIDGGWFDKEIAKAMGRKKSLKVKFGFYSANAQSHYLTL